MAAMYRVGDVVRINADLSTSDSTGCVNVVYDMLEYRGKEVTIRRIDEYPLVEQGTLYLFNEVGFNWVEDWFTPVTQHEEVNTTELSREDKIKYTEKYYTWLLNKFTTPRAMQRVMLECEVKEQNGCRNKEINFRDICKNIKNKAVYITKLSERERNRVISKVYDELFRFVL